MHEPKISEIKKAERLACKLTGKTDCKVSGYFTAGAKGDFQTFECEILSDGCKERELNIYIEAFIPDRRRSWAHAIASYTQEAIDALEIKRATLDEIEEIHNRK